MAFFRTDRILPVLFCIGFISSAFLFNGDYFEKTCHPIAHFMGFPMFLCHYVRSADV